MASGRHSRPKIRGRHRRPSQAAHIVTATAGGIAAGGILLASPAQAQVAVPGSPPVHYPEHISVMHARVLSDTTVTVAHGDTLSGIAARLCGNPADWTGIYNRNKPVIGGNPDEISAGQHLTLSCTTARVAESYSPGVTASYVTVSGDLSFGGLESLWESAGGPSWAAWDAATIAECESGGRQYAYNLSGASGYWQILGEDVPGDIYDPMVNAENAVAKFKGDGDTFAAWVCQA